MVETWNETWWHRDVLCVFCATHCWNFLWRHISIGSQILEALIRELCERAQATVLTMRFPVLDLQQCGAPWALAISTGRWADLLTLLHKPAAGHAWEEQVWSPALWHCHAAQHVGWGSCRPLLQQRGVQPVFPLLVSIFSLCVCSMQELRFRSSWEISCPNLMFWPFKEMNYFKSPCLEWKWRCPRCRKKFVIIL